MSDEQVQRDNASPQSEDTHPSVTFERPLRIVAVDDEPLALANLERLLHHVAPMCEAHSFALPAEALEHIRQHPTDAVFCDIEMPQLNGLEFARLVKEIQPEAHIVFATSFERYAIDAFALHATGYLLKPVDEDELRRELTFIYEHVPVRTAIARVQTFGDFEVTVDDEPVLFRRSKARELLALLVDRRGRGVSSREACELLWEGEPYSRAQRSYYQTVVAELRAALDRAGAGDIICKAWNSLAVVPEKLDCDLYRFLEGDPVAINAYRGEYLPAYPWAEFSIGEIERAYWTARPRP